MIKHIILLFFVTSLISAQVEHSRSENAFAFGPNFDFDVASYPTGSSELTRVDVFLKIPYSNLQFVNDREGFVAKYSVTLTFYDEDKDNIILERLWKERISTKDFGGTVSSKNYNYSYRSFDFKPDKYLIRCEVQDKDSKRNFVVEVIANIEKFYKDIEVSDLIFVTNKIQSESGPKLIPSVSNKMTSRDSSLYFFYEIYSTKQTATSVEYTIQDKNDEVIFKGVSDIELKKGNNFIEHKIPGIQFTLGSYKLIAQVRNEEWEITDGTSKKFVSHIYGYPSSITDLDLAIEQMTYIAGGTEISKIEDAEDYSEKLALYQEYWKSKDPSPNTEENEVLNEYYRRIDYANKHFKHYFDGWKTDMGMIYIVLGPPSNVERHPFEYSSKPYEIWDYYDINKRFVFVDQTGFGDYRLLDQQYGDWYRYRQ